MIGTWQVKTRGTRLTVTVEPFTGVGAGLRVQVEAEAAELARFRGALTAGVVVSAPLATA